MDLPLSEILSSALTLCFNIFSTILCDHKFLQNSVKTPVKQPLFRKIVKLKTVIAIKTIYIYY